MISARAASADSYSNPAGQGFAKLYIRQRSVRGKHSKCWQAPFFDRAHEVDATARAVISSTSQHTSDRLQAGRHERTDFSFRVRAFGERWRFSLEFQIGLIESVSINQPQDIVLERIADHSNNDLVRC